MGTHSNRFLGGGSYYLPRSYHYQEFLSRLGEACSLCFLQRIDFSWVAFCVCLAFRISIAEINYINFTDARWELIFPQATGNINSAALSLQTNEL